MSSSTPELLLRRLEDSFSSRIVVLEEQGERKQSQSAPEADMCTNLLRFGDNCNSTTFFDACDGRSVGIVIDPVRVTEGNVGRGGCLVAGREDEALRE